MSLLTPSRAEEFFNEIAASPDPVGFLKRLVGSHATDFEAEYLEYKGAEQLSPSGDELKKVWSKSLSCFANSDGGVIIWGIAAPKDKPRTLSLVKNIEEFNGKLHEMLRDVTDPPVQGVQIKLYPETPGATSGFIACFIPGSPWRPHRAKARSNEFFMRAGDNCVPCSLAVLRALFAPETVSVLNIFWKTSVEPQQLANSQEIVFRCWLENSGPSTARDVFLLCLPPRGLRQFPSFDHGIWSETVSGMNGIPLLAKRSIHPTELVPVIYVRIGWFVGKEDIQGKSENPVFVFQVFARDQLPMKFRVDLSHINYGSTEKGTAERIK